MSNLKGYRKIDKYLTNWCKNQGFDVKCKLGADFEYEDETKTIYYALVVPQDHDDLFMKICSKYMPDIEKCDTFLISFFHELGHYITDNNYLDEDWDNYYKFCAKLKKKKKLSDKDYYNYYNYPIELDATKWGCKYINNNIEVIKNLLEELTPLILDFYKVNKVEID